MADFDTAYVPLEVNRHVPFSEEIRFVGFDYSAASFAAQIRETRSVTGTPWLTFSFSAPSVVDEEGVNVTTVTMTATKTLVDAIPATGSGTDTERGDDLKAWWDLLITPGAATTQFRALEGPATIKPGATI